MVQRALMSWRGRVCTVPVSGRSTAWHRSQPGRSSLAGRGRRSRGGLLPQHAGPNWGGTCLIKAPGPGVLAPRIDMQFGDRDELRQLAGSDVPLDADFGLTLEPFFPADDAITGEC